MSTQPQLLAAIQADPEADAPRLVYADWLDEHDDPARAEFVRVGCALARAAAARDAAEFPLRRRAWWLEAEHGDRWRAELPADERWEWSGFRRGFAERLDIRRPPDGSPLPEGVADVVFDTLHLSLDNGPTPFPEAELLEGVRSLRVGHYRGAVHPALSQIRWLIRSGMLDRPKRLDWRGWIPEVEWRELTRPRSGVAWEELTLSSLFTAEGIAGLAEIGAPLSKLRLLYERSDDPLSPNLDRLMASFRLREYEQAGGMLTESDAAGLCRGGVERLTLNGVEFGRGALRHLGSGLGPNLREYSLDGGEYIPADTWAELLAAPGLTGLEALQISGRSLERLRPDWLEEAAFADSLRRLVVPSPRCAFPSGWGGERIRSGQLLVLVLSVPLGDAGLADLLRPCGEPSPLAILRLDGARLTEAAAGTLRRATHLGGLQTLGLLGNQIGEGCVRAIAESPQFAGLTRLDLSSTLGGPGVLRALLASPVLSPYLELHVDRTPGLDVPELWARYRRPARRERG